MRVHFCECTVHRSKLGKKQCSVKWESPFLWPSFNYWWSIMTILCLIIIILITMSIKVIIFTVHIYTISLIIAIHNLLLATLVMSLASNAKNSGTAVVFIVCMMDKVLLDFLYFVMCWPILMAFWGIGEVRQLAPIITRWNYSHPPWKQYEYVNVQSTCMCMYLTS